MLAVAALLHPAGRMDAQVLGAGHKPCHGSGSRWGSRTSDSLSATRAVVRQLDAQGETMRSTLICICLFVASHAWGHIGSPNVYFEGKAGPFPTRVVIRPPG